MVKVDSHLFYPASSVSLSVHRPSIHPFTHPLIYGVLGELWARIYVSVLRLCMFFPNYCPSSTLTPGDALGPLPCPLSLLRTYSMDPLAHALHVCVPHRAPGDVTLSASTLAGTPPRCLNPEHHVTPPSLHTAGGHRLMFLTALNSILLLAALSHFCLLPLPLTAHMALLPVK